MVFYAEIWVLNNMAIKVILTGATGFVGEGVLLECLANPDVTEVLMVNRRPFDLQHPKLKELILPDFLQAGQYSAQMAGYDACFYCAGISSAGMKEAEYSKITYDATLAFAQAVLPVNKAMTFCFVSGSHTDGTGQGKVMWARVKGRTENALSKMPFKQVCHFRPGGMIATEGQRNARTWYKILIKIMNLLVPKLVSTLKEVGLAMIHASIRGSKKQVLEIKDIKALAK